MAGINLFTDTDLFSSGKTKITKSFNLLEKTFPNVTPIPSSNYTKSIDETPLTDISLQQETPQQAENKNIFQKVVSFVGGLFTPKTISPISLDNGIQVSLTKPSKIINNGLQPDFGVAKQTPSAQLTPEVQKKVATVETNIAKFIDTQTNNIAKIQKSTESKLGLTAIGQGERETYASFIRNFNPQLADKFDTFTEPVKDTVVNNVLKFVGQQLPYIPLTLLTEGLLNPVTGAIASKVPLGTSIATNVLSNMGKAAIKFAPIAGILSGLPATKTPQERIKNIALGTGAGALFGGVTAGVGTIASELIAKFGTKSESFLANWDLVTKVLNSTDENQYTPKELSQVKLLNEVGLTSEALKNPITVTTQSPAQGPVWDFLRSIFTGRYIPKEGAPKAPGNLLTPGEHTPQEVFNHVVDTKIQDTPDGKALMQAAVEAQKSGKNIVISGNEAASQFDKAISTYISDEGMYKKPDGTMEQTPSLQELTKIAETPEAQKITTEKVNKAIESGEIKKNDDGSITVYRVGTPRTDRLMSVSYDKASAEQFVEQASVTGEKRPINEIIVKPEDVKVFIGGTEKELLVQSPSTGGEITKTSNVDEIIRKISNGSEFAGGRGVQGMKLNEGELKMLMGHVKGIQTPENQKWAGKIVKTWTGDKDLVIGVVKEADGGNSFLVTSYGNKNPEYKGVLRLHRTPMSEKEIVGQFGGSGGEMGKSITLSKEKALSEYSEDLQLVSEAIQSGDLEGARAIYDNLSKDFYTPSFNSLKAIEDRLQQRESAQQSNETAQAIKESYGQYAGTIQKMKNFLRIASENTSKEGMLFREHIPRRVFGVGSDEIATDLGMSENDLMSKMIDELGIQKEKVLPVPKEVEIPSPNLPIGKGDERVSKLEARMKGVIGKATPEQIDALGLTTYNKMNRKETIADSAKYVIEHPEEALEVLQGKREAPQGQYPESIYVAMLEVAKNDLTLATKLITLQATTIGQRLSLLAEIDPLNPVKIGSDIYKIKEETFKTRYNGKTVKEVTERMVAKGKAKIKAPKLTDWSSFIDAVRC